MTHWLKGGGRESLAWAAGLFDGEGCFLITRGGVGRRFDHLQCRAKIGMTDQPVVSKFAEVIGFGSTTIKRVKNPKHNNQLEWRISTFEEFQQLMVMLWPWLGIRRRAKAKSIQLEYLAWARLKAPRRRGVIPVPRHPDLPYRDAREPGEEG